MGFIDRRKPRQRGRYKSTDFANLTEAKSFAVMGPLPEKKSLNQWDIITQGIRLHELGLCDDDYVEAIKILKNTFKIED